MGELHRIHRNENDRPATSDASFTDRVMGRCREYVGRFLRKIACPGAVRSCDITDQVTRKKIEIRVGAMFTRISIDGRDYFFDRLTGRFDGTGVGCH